MIVGNDIVQVIFDKCNLKIINEIHDVKFDLNLSDMEFISKYPELNELRFQLERNSD